MIKYLLLLAISFAGTITYAQTIEGRVTNHEGNPIAFANVQFLNTKKGTMTNENGNYGLNAKAGSYQIAFSYVGFAKVVKSITLTKNETKNFRYNSKRTI